MGHVGSKTMLFGQLLEKNHVYMVEGIVLIQSS